MTFLAGQQIKSGVICKDSTVSHEIKCEQYEIIDIQSVTVAVLEDTQRCTVENLIRQIEELPSGCRLSGNVKGRTYGAEIYRR